MGRPSFKEVADALIAKPGDAFQLNGDDAGVRPFFDDKDDARDSAREDSQAINALQDRLFAEGQRSLLVVLQGIDCAGKSGTVRAVFNATGPLGVRVTPFGKPTELELSHDYLWRCHAATPAKGHIGIWDRSHYEDVLVVRVRELAPLADIEKRYDQINAFEAHLADNGVTVLKFFLNISYKEQGERLRARLDNPNKRWKFNPSDIEDRKLWDAYMAAYEMAITRCSTKTNPWYVIPADSKSYRSALIGRIVRGALEEMNPAPRDPGYRLEDYDID